MRIAVLIVNWNSRPLLERCLAGLRQQTRRPDRTVVIDNGSEPGSLDGLERSHEEVQLIRLTDNVGFAEANNIGVAAVPDCDWVALLNPDAFPEPGWLEALARAAEGQAGYVCFASQMRMAESPDRVDGAGDAYHVSGLAWRRYHALPGSEDTGTTEVFSACAAAALYNRRAYLEAGGLDHSYFCYAEDVDLGFRLRLAGGRCLYVADAVVIHVGSALSGWKSDFSVYHGHRNLVWTFIKNMPPVMFWLYLPQHLLLNLISLGWFSSRGQARTIFKAKWDAVRQLPRVWRDRRRIQAGRLIDSRTLRRSMDRGVLTPYLVHARQGTRGETR